MFLAKKIMFVFVSEKTAVLLANADVFISSMVNDFETIEQSKLKRTVRYHSERTIRDIKLHLPLI